MHKIVVLASFYSVYDRPTLIFKKSHNIKVHFSSNLFKQSGLKAPNNLRKRLNSRPIPTKSNIGPQALLLNDFAVHSTAFVRSVWYKIFFPCIKFCRDWKNIALLNKSEIVSYYRP